MTFDEAAGIVRPLNELTLLREQNKKYAAALEQIGNMHLGDQPASSDLSEVHYAQRQIGQMRGIALRALGWL